MQTSSVADLPPHLVSPIEVEALDWLLTQARRFGLALVLEPQEPPDWPLSAAREPTPERLGRLGARMARVVQRPSACGLRSSVEILGDAQAPVARILPRRPGPEPLLWRVLLTALVAGTEEVVDDARA